MEPLFIRGGELFLLVQKRRDRLVPFLDRVGVETRLALDVENKRGWSNNFKGQIQTESHRRRKVSKI